ncbi:MAG TPA: hypothetical protein PL009_09535 [Flavipsychrobacter sp.]|nr:hypothetical protein [Flavipsychrobacter sp.]
MTIIPLEPFNRDNRGYNCEYYHDRMGQHVLVYSKAGAVRGGHYHKGISLTKNPEIVILLSGVCTLNWRQPNSSTLETKTVEGPVRIEIPPYTWHQFIFATESVMFEMNSLSEHAADTFYDQ